ncbi:MAG TPA: NAD(P)-dependent oxidoreductase [Terriglobales bacterium]|nr:NAD(P)-dependent oxidoreductase [Terriglobales bacterium]
MSRILVTGASGFLGRQALPLLANGSHQVFAVSRAPLPDTSGTISWIAADLLQTGEPSRVIGESRPDQLLHFAWCARPGEFWFSSENPLWLRASLELVESFCRHGGSRAVVVGSCAEYDWSAAVNPCREEETPLRPHSLYGASKHALHLLLATSPLTAGLSLAWARLFHLYGPFEPEGKIVGSAIRTFLAGRLLHSATTGTQVRDFLYAPDAAAALVALLQSPVAGPVNIASGRPVTVRALLECVAAETGTPDLLGFGARVDEPSALTASIDRLEREVGWKPAHELASGIRATVTQMSRMMADNGFAPLGCVRKEI